MKKTAKDLFNSMAIRSADQIAEAIRRIRKLSGMSQMDLAKKSGLTQAAISRFENSSKKAEIGTLIFAALNADLIVAF
ncbi:MAG: hypothetical protein B7Y39_18620 [Bdellovibrio sp. 28-41-41]|nr:MAG: hypothetical protein B7Y39_18620 [Bdellovibrio sp. 28-41-41]